MAALMSDPKVASIIQSPSVAPRFVAHVIAWMQGGGGGSL